MQVSVTFRHMEATEALKTFASDKVSRIEKYVHTPTDAHVVLSVERGHMHRAEINVTANGIRIRGEETSEDMYGSIDGATAKIERQLKRYRNKLASHKPREGHAMKVKHQVIASSLSAEGEVPIESPPTFVRHEEVDARPMIVEEAIMQMELMHEEFHVFLNAKTNAMNVLYRRKDGTLGLIEPPHAHAAANGKAA
jgi:putative sigma-54 modulation protein